MPEDAEMTGSQGAIAGPPPAAPGASYRFLVVGDTQRSADSRDLNDAARAAVYDRVRAALADGSAAFAFHVGDLVETGGDAARWRDDFDVPFWARLSPGQRTRFFPVPGNHEYKTHLLDYGGGDLGLYFRRFPHLERQRYYYFFHGRACFVALDSGRNGIAKVLLGERWQNGFEEQVAWLTNRVFPEIAERAAAGQLDCVFVFFHKPAYPTPVTLRNAQSAQVLELFDRLLRDAGHDLRILAFSGHIHTFSHIRREAGSDAGTAIEQLIMGGGGGVQAGSRYYRRVKRIEDLDLYRRQKLGAGGPGAGQTAFDGVRRDDTHFGYLDVVVGPAVEIIYHRFDPDRGDFYEDYRFSR